MKRFRCETQYFEPAALVGAMWTEGSDDDVPAGFDRFPNHADIPRTGCWIHEKVEHRAIVPEVVSVLREIRPSYVSAQPMDC